MRKVSSGMLSNSQVMTSQRLANRCSIVLSLYWARKIVCATSNAGARGSGAKMAVFSPSFAAAIAVIRASCPPPMIPTRAVILDYLPSIICDQRVLSGNFFTHCVCVARFYICFLPVVMWCL